MHIALLLMMSSPNLADDFYNSKDNCTVSGTVIETEIKTDINYPCSDDINIIIQNDLWLYNIKWNIVPKNGIICVGWWSIFNQENYPKEWDIIDYLVYDWGNWYYDILSTNKLYEWAYKVPNGTISENNFNVCELNIKPIQKEIIFEDTKNNFIIAKNIKNQYEIFINGSFIINLDTLYENSIESTKILKYIKNWEVYISEINKVLSSLELEKLILAFKNFSSVDINNIKKYKEILNYMWYQIWIEIFWRNNINIKNK